MNLQIINLTDSNKLKDLGKNLSIPSVFYYKSKKENKSVSDLVNNFTCNKDTCCIDLNVYKNLLDNIKANKTEMKQYNKKLTRRKSKKYKSMRKSKKL